MVQKFVTVEIDEDDYYCDEQYCDVRIFISGVGGVCPCCREIGKRVGNEEK